MHAPYQEHVNNMFFVVVVSYYSRSAVIQKLNTVVGYPAYITNEIRKIYLVSQHLAR